MDSTLLGGHNEIVLSMMDYFFDHCWERTMPVKVHLLQRARMLARNRCPADARRLVLAVLVDEPGNEDAWLCYGETYFELGERIRIFERGLKQNPEMARVRHELSQIIFTQEEKLLADDPGIMSAPTIPTLPVTSNAPGLRMPLLCMPFNVLGHPPFISVLVMVFVFILILMAAFTAYWL
jgi:hypothetical protein